MLLLVCGTAEVRGGSLNRDLDVGTKPALLFAIRMEGGEWTGIDLRRRVAEDPGLNYEFLEMDLEGLPTGLEDGIPDAPVAALTG